MCIRDSTHTGATKPAANADTFAHDGSIRVFAIGPGRVRGYGTASTTVRRSHVPRDFSRHEGALPLPSVLSKPWAPRTGRSRRFQS
eukprot:3432348-Prymnesium_polylepis.1